MPSFEYRVDAMPTIVPYDHVTARMLAQGYKCNYYNGGAFAFADRAAPVKHLGWVGPEDTTIRLEAIAMARQVAPPFEENLAALLASVTAAHFPGPVWAMPMSHWAFELDYGSREWMPAALADVNVDAAELEGLTNAAAIEFAQAEAGALRRFTQALLTNLQASDFMLAFVGRPILCTVHHHKQLWWTTTDASVIDAVEAAVAPTGDNLPRPG
jgi:hypothetical protein